MTFPSYSVGTVSVHRGDTVIAGAGGPLWTATANARAGDDIIIAGHIWPLSDVIDAAHLLIDPWPFDDVPAGTPYKILQRSPLRFAGGDAAADVIQLIGALNTAGLSFIVPIGVAAPDPSLGEENQFAIQPSTFKLWLKTSGQWVFQGIFKGFQVRGPYSATAAYVVNDIVSRDGASYVALVDSTGQPVTNAAVWALFAAKGDQGPQGAPGANGTNGAGYAATSTASLTIGTGPQMFTTPAGLAYSVGARARASNGANYMEGLVTTYSGTSLTINVTRTGGAGTFASWNINLAGDPGTGDMLAANNLSDLTNKPAALNTLNGVSYGAAQALTAVQSELAKTNIAVLRSRSWSGLNHSNDGISPSTKLDVGAGWCRDSTDVLDIVCAAGVINTGVVGANGIDVAASWVSKQAYTFAIAKSDGTQAYLASLSPTAPTLPTGYVYFRRIGSFRTDSSGNIVPFIHVADHWYYAGTPIRDFNASVTTAAFTAITLSVPAALGVQAIFEVTALPASGTTVLFYVMPGFLPDTAKTGWGTDVNNSTGYALNMTVQVSSTAQIKVIAGSVSHTIVIDTAGWIDPL